VSGQDSSPSEAAPSSAPPCCGLELPELLERVDPDVRVGADAGADPALAEALEGREAVPKVRLGRRADADPRAGVGQEVELPVLGVGRMDDGRPGAEAARLRQELDRTDAVLL
jgi:hypothetical protein